MTRLFFGITLDGPTSQSCAAVQERLQAAAFPARYEPPEKLHLTLAFLGNVAAEALERVEAICDDVASRVSPFDLTLDRLSAFPNERRPRVVFVGSRNQGVSFRTLATAVRDACFALGFSFNDDAIAHVTLARVKGGSARALPMLDVEPMTIRVCELALFESIPEKETTRYVVRRTALLTG